MVPDPALTPWLVSRPVMSAVAADTSPVTIKSPPVVRGFPETRLIEANSGFVGRGMLTEPPAVMSPVTLRVSHVNKGKKATDMGCCYKEVLFSSGKK